MTAPITPDLKLPTQYLRQMIELGRSMGADVPAWLAMSGLTEAALNDPTRTISFPVFRQLVLDGLMLTREPAIGLFIGDRLLPGTHGVVGYAAMSSGSIRQMLDLFSRYTPLRFSLVRIHCEYSPDEARIVFIENYPLGDIERAVLEAVVMTVRKLLDSITLGVCEVREVAFPFAEPEYAHIARDLFRCPVTYNASWTGFTLPAAVLDIPLRMADPEAFREATLICQRELEKLTGNETLAARVRRLLLERPEGLPSLPVTARLVHMSERTLHRRLAEEGTSYKELVEEVRHMLALEHLKADRLSIQEIAYALGYSDLANFRRAFKRWQGTAPSTYRETHIPHYSISSGNTDTSADPSISANSGAKLVKIASSSRSNG